MEPRRSRKIVEFPIIKPEERLTNPDARIDHKRLQNIRNYNLTNETRTVKAIVAPPGLAGLGDFTDIQTAINFVNADGGGTVFLQNGVYTLNESISLPNGVNLIGQSQGNGINITEARSLVGVVLNLNLYQIVVQGAEPYITGTISNTFGSSIVTGSGTSFTQSMVGQSILINGYWRVIVQVNSATELLAPSSYISKTVSGVDCIIASPAINTISNLTLRRCSETGTGAISYLYTDKIVLNSVIFFEPDLTFTIKDSSLPLFRDISVINADAGIIINNVGGLVADNLYINSLTSSSSTGGISITNMVHSSMSDFSIEGMFGTGITITSSSDFFLDNGFINSNAGYGIRVSSSTDGSITNMIINNNSSDGIELTGTADRFIISGCHITSNGLYGVDLTAATDDNNLIIGNIFTTNTSGAVNNTGTGTLIRSNIGQADN